MIDYLERVSDNNYRGFFVDLYVRCTNNVAIGMYEGLGYSVYRRVREYYGSLGMGRNAKDEEDAFGVSRRPTCVVDSTDLSWQICGNHFLEIQCGAPCDRMGERSLSVLTMYRNRVTLDSPSGAKLPSIQVSKKTSLLLIAYLRGSIFSPSLR